MYDELVKRLREVAEYVPCIMDRECAEDAIKAADAIEELKKAVNFHKFNSEFWEDKYNSLADEKWISVTERLPDFEGCLLCMRKAFVGDNLRYQDILYYEEGTFYMEFEDTPIPTEAITHWMPLPQPPNAEEGE